MKIPTRFPSRFLQMCTFGPSEQTYLRMMPCTFDRGPNPGGKERWLRQLAKVRSTKGIVYDSREELEELVAKVWSAKGEGLDGKWVVR